MSGSGHILALGAGEHESRDADHSNRETALSRSPGVAADPGEPLAERATASERASAAGLPVVDRPAADWFTPALALGAVAVWSAWFGWAWSDAIAAGLAPRAWTGLVTDWTVPVLLVGVVWLIAMRGSRREAVRFGDTARQLGDESARLERRLLNVNRELSLAREFITAQARDLETLGRLASDRLSEGASQLEDLIHVNRERLDAIGSVSRAALDNMEQLRGQLPVVASSARDMTNQIASAGRTAQLHLEELHEGLEQVGYAGAANDRQVTNLRTAVSAAMDEFGRHADQLEVIATARFAALTERGAEFRAQLHTHEIAALGAVRGRAGVLTGELETLRRTLASDEDAALGALQTRLAGLSEESAGIAARMRDGEAIALERWRDGIARLEGDLDEALASLAKSEGEAIAASRNRLEALADEALRIDTLLAEREREFTDALSRRSDAARAAQDEALAALRERLGALDREIAWRRENHERQGAAIAAHGEAISGLLTQFDERAANIAALGGATGDALAAGLDTLGTRLAESRSALAATGDDVHALIAASERLHQRIEAIGEQSAEYLPDALANSEARTATLGDAVGRIGAGIDEVSRRGAGLNDLLESTAGALVARFAEIDARAGTLEARFEAARRRAEAQHDDHFARSAALITEALNSRAIDLAKAFSNEVSDTAWAAYLRGDRGIFTRRAVSLLGGADRRSVAALYRSDAAFRELVSRYIHDFEAILRQVLSARDGHVLGVTLISSDIGKLYVVLAQSIERLRGS